MVVGKQFFLKDKIEGQSLKLDGKSFHILTALGKYEDWKYV
jgi:hypothetical protein